MPLVDDYLSYTKKWKEEYGEKTLVLMQVGTFFEVYALLDENGKKQGSNIEEFSRITDMAMARKRQKVGDLKVMMAGVPLAQLDKNVNKLQEAGYTTVIYTQDVQGKNTTRSLAQIVSPERSSLRIALSCQITLCVSGLTSLTRIGLYRVK